MSKNGNNHKKEGLIEGIVRLIPIAVCGVITHHNPKLEALL
jgi:hypothetical protein